MNTTETISAKTLDITSFTGHDKLEVRLWITKPWRHDGRIFATNGHVMVALDDDGREGIDEYVAGKHPIASNMLKAAPGAEFIPLPDIGPVAAPCKRCGGSGFHFRVDCEDCDGNGRFDFGKHTYTCAECSGEGLVGSETERARCEVCEGFGESGRWVDCDKTDIADARFQSRYLRLFVGLPNVQIAVQGPTRQAILKFDGGMGVVMPMRK